ncbi:autotransporter domain-containing protein [Thioalkalivibrio sp. ALR17-21]|uniref:autotransporter domain-containing protein n=1 Tax=Thioalkalivibrio sp. ALR17-21 TaxID=1269813 RepID=UPI001E4E1831|nr:autotransporter domain-containing protein [Thioalkalivibrio sp. ALR17-21]
MFGDNHPTIEYLEVGASNPDTPTLTIEDGASLTVIAEGEGDPYGMVRLAAAEGGYGEVRIRGEGSTLTSDLLFVGSDGTGRLYVEDGATLVTADHGLDNESVTLGSSGSGQAVVSGEDSVWEIAGDVWVGGDPRSADGPKQGLVRVTDGGHVDVQWDLILAHDEDGTGVLEIGAAGGDPGTVGVSSEVHDFAVRGGPGHSLVDFSHAADEYYFTDDGTADGVPTLLREDLRVRHIGSGTTTLVGSHDYTGWTRVDDGALAMEDGTFEIGNVDVRSDSTFRVGPDGVVNADEGRLHHEDTRMLVDGTDARWSSDSLRVDAGEVVAQNRGLVDVYELFLGEDAHDARVGVEGGGSLEVDHRLIIGHEGSGTLEIVDQGSVRVEDEMTVGRDGEGSLLVDYSILEVAGDSPLRLGESDTGSMVVRNGDPDRALLRARYMHMGIESDGAGELRVSGADTLVDITSGLDVGVEGEGVVVVEDGARLQGNVRLGTESGGQGTLEAYSEGTRLEGGYHFAVGESGDGVALLADGAVAGMDLVALGRQDSSTGHLRLGEGDAAGIVDAREGIEYGDGDNLLEFHHDEDDYHFTRDGTVEGSAVALNARNDDSSTLDVRQRGEGTTILTGDYDFEGGVEILEGTLQLGAGEDTGSLTAPVENDGVLAFNRADEYTVEADVSGGGDLVQRGEGTLILDSEQDYTGETRVESGTLVADADLSAASARVLDGGTLAGRGTLGDTTVEDGGRLDPGNSVGSLTVDGDLLLSPDSRLDFALGAPGEDEPDAGTSDRIEVTGDLTLDGVLDLRQSEDGDDGDAGFGYYRLMTWEGALTDNELEIGESPELDEGALFLLNPEGGYLDMHVAVAGDDTLQHWQGGDGTWSDASEQWMNDGGEVAVPWAGNHGVFRDEGDYRGGTVEVEGTQSFKGLQFVDEDYRLEGPGAIAPDADEDGELRVLADRAEIAVDITGDGELYKTEGGTAVLTGEATHTGGTRVESGVLQVGDGGTEGRLTGDVELLEPGTLRMDRSDAVTLDGDVTGDGDLVHAGDGTLVLTGDVAPGETLIEGATLQVGDGGEAGTLDGDVHNDGTLVFDRADTVVFGGALEGEGDLVQRGEGTLAVDGAQALEGETRVESGVLRVDGDLGGSATTVTDNATLTGDGTVGATRVEDGGVMDLSAGAGALRIDGDLALDPDATLDVALGEPGEENPADGVSGRVEVAGDLTLDGTLDLRASEAPDAGDPGLGYYRLMTWEGDLNDRDLAVGDLPELEEDVLHELQYGDDRLDLFIGLEGDDSLQHWQGGDGTWTQDGSDWLNDGGEIAVAWGGQHAVFKDADPYRGGTVEVEGTQAFEGMQFVDSGYRLRGDGELETSDEGEIRVLASHADIRADITGSGALTKTEEGTLLFSGDADHAGGTDVEAGELLLDGGSIDHAGAETRVGIDGGTARLGVEDGATVRDGGATLGEYENAAGHARVQGAGSRWENDGGLRVGAAGEGELELRSGGELVSDFAYIGAAGTGSGRMHASGDGTHVDIADDLIVGDGGQGRVEVERGARLGAGALDIGYADSAEGSTTVAGNAARLEVDGRLTAGTFGEGELVIADGAEVQSGSGSVARFAEAGGQAAVTGEGSQWAMDGMLEVAAGRDSTGTVQVAEGGRISAGAAVALGAGADSDATLEIGGADAAGVVEAERIEGMGDGATLSLTHGQEDYHLTSDGTAGGDPVTLSGDLDVVHAGSGMTVIEGEHDLSGDADVAGGNLRVNGSMADSAVTVHAGAVISGTGTVGDLNVASGGQVRPGNSVGTLAVAGDMTLESDSVHVVEVSEDGSEADHTGVGGELTIEDGVRLHVTEENGGDGRLFEGDEITHTVLTAEDGVDGSFDEVSDDFAFLDTSVAYSDTGVQLTLSRVAVFESAAETANQRAVAGALDELAGDERVSALVDSLLVRDTHGARAGLDSLSGADHTHAQQVGMRSDQRFRGLLRGRMGGTVAPAAGEVASLSDLAGTQWASAGRPSGASATSTPESDRRWWVRAQGGQGEIDDTSGAAGSDYSFGGIALGADTSLGEDGFMGVGLGFSRATADSGAADIDVDSWQVAVYGGWERNGYYVRGDIGASYHDAETDRDVALTGDTAEASYSATGVGAGVEFGRGFDVGERTRVSPFAGLDYQQQSRESFTESGAGQANLQVDSEREHSLRTRLGVNLDQHFETAGGAELVPNVEVAWLQEHGDRASEMRTAFDGAPEQRFTIEGPELSRDRIHVNAGLSARFGEGSRVDVGYHGEFASSDDVHAAGITFRQSW